MYGGVVVVYNVVSASRKCFAVVDSSLKANVCAELLYVHVMASPLEVTGSDITT